MAPTSLATLPPTSPTQTRAKIPPAVTHHHMGGSPVGTLLLGDTLHLGGSPGDTLLLGATHHLGGSQRGATRERIHPLMHRSRREGAPRHRPS